ncbi:hypothetical protein FHT44_005002 [Mycolicibacterium sp. BK634]|uniref:hypothetical protein n=1 Tax=Mycolicibacterium sp. BK634 TaxID=2587099 RepID=UPI0016226BED|nr:hypothetical protein [Mycolicibacterium sp. BK634]MBB3752490.1 hypothetical protein [Mycolicibacterium sp. BK634]
MSKQISIVLPEPSEYSPWGEPQWNSYPFVRVEDDAEEGDEIVVGVSDEHLYKINPYEAQDFAASLLAAADKLLSR